MRKLYLILIISLGAYVKTTAFCGFYVAKAGAELFNNKSEVILVRDGQTTTITMSNDFKGNVKDFAMVIPVPNVLTREDIRIVERSIFQSLDAYSSPRLVEYYDANPCAPVYNYDMVQLEEVRSTSMRERLLTPRSDDNYKVTIEAQYSVEEYEILILSAEESDGLKRWLIANDYSIPEKAEEVLEPYIKNKLKFFVVKVNLDKYNPQEHGGYLRPLQIKVKSDRFMLPIRLGMANSNGEQDMIVYAFTKTGRIESTNYRTVKIPTDRNIPTFIKQRFGEFYKDLFNNSYQKEGKNSVFLEYAWNVSPSWGGVKCDPCVGNPPYFTDLATAGVDWLDQSNPAVFFTRLHIRYAKEQFPEDLFFQITPNKESFQGRYILTHPASGDLQCDEAKGYLADLRKRRTKELLEMAVLATWDPVEYTNYIYTGDGTPDKSDRGELLPVINSVKPYKKIPKLIFAFSALLLAVFVINQIKRKYNLSNI